MTTTFDTLGDAIADAKDAEIEDARIIICHGPPRCTLTDGNGCPFCYIVPAGDTRSTDEIMEAMRAEH